ncbi:unnamed protein product [Trifolium pratense]|uniref:Uncharacterized protein n=1 Tax=Trifolium pratense TaxID=57577 RepID=A0ACB0KKC0_TRIPR|nr:unnamed protein product [Trifolium pratense]
MEISKVYLIGVISFLLISFVIGDNNSNYGLNNEIRRGGPRRTPATKGSDPITSPDAPSTQIKKLVQSGSDPIESPPTLDNLPTSDYGLNYEIKRGGPRRSPPSKGSDPVISPDPPSRPDRPPTRDYGFNY